MAYLLLTDIVQRAGASGGPGSCPGNVDMTGVPSIESLESRPRRLNYQCVLQGYKFHCTGRA
jgi:hypothetical protein